MPEPVLVVHGVGNRDKAAFTRRVAALNEAAGDAWEFLPVYWGDLGAISDDDIFAALPVVRGLLRRAVRDLEGAGEIDSPWLRLLQAELAGDDPGEGLETVRASDERLRAREEAIVRGAADRVQADAAPAGVRGPAAGAAVDASLRDLVRRELPATRYLQHIDDPAVLEGVGRVLADAALLGAEAATSTGAETRGSGAPPGGLYDTPGEVESTRGLLDTIKKAPSLVRDLDDLLGKAVDGALGTANQAARRWIGPGLVRSLGDVLVYQRHRAEIQSRLWQAIDAWQGPNWTGPRYGSRERPINVIAHSLGGVASFDAALDRERPLWIKALLTFGSQAAFFHTIDPRVEIPRFTTGSPALLPPTIARWTNLWEPLDLLAFTAGVVFRFDPDGQPRDVEVASAVSEIWDARGWTHSAYWESDELITEMKRTLVP